MRLAGGDAAELIVPNEAAPDPIAPPASEPAPRQRPLVDWRSLTCPRLPDEAFALVGADPGDPAALAAAARAQVAGRYPALRRGGLLVLPAAPWWRSRLRAIKCRATDPVVFAVAEGENVARFPELAGWSVGDTALRAVAEYRAWLHGARGPWALDGASNGDGAHLALLFSAARAGLLRESIRAGEPELTLTVAATARRLGERSAAGWPVADEAVGQYREFALRGTPPSPGTAASLRRLVQELPSYSDSAAPAHGPLGSARA